jgi:type II secretory pathway component PulM
MYQKIERYITNLSKREKLVLLTAGAVLGVFILLAGVVSPMMEYKSRLAASVNAKDSQLRRVYELSSQIRTISDVSKNGKALQTANFTLFGFLEELAARIKVNDRIEYMKPISEPGDSSREAVEVKIRSVFQEDLISLLYDIEHSPHSLKIKRLNIRRVERDNCLDVTFQVVHYG